MRIFLDGANIGQIIEMNDKVDGFTTNPSLIRKLDIPNYEDFAKEVLNHTNKPVSFEIISDDFNEMERQARIISSWGKNVWVKIPITNTNGESTLPVIKNLSDIKLNITAIMLPKQIKYIIPELKSDDIISVFAGRIADTGINPIPIIREIRAISDIDLLWASTREVYNIVQAMRCECDIITITPQIFNKLSLLGKDLEELSLDTVKQFYEDAKGYTI